MVAYLSEKFLEHEPAATVPLLAATRCWRAARDAGHPVQPCLTAALCPYDCEMLAPCLDSLLSFAEAALGRPLRVADSGSLSADEHLLLDLLTGVRCTRACLDCDVGVARALDCALCSTRIMLALEHPGSREHRAPQ